MGISHYSESAGLPNMDPFGNPNKKLRLDGNARNNSPSLGDDLWGQDDITAEEFDMLETQATQSHKAQDTFLQPTGISSININGVNNKIELESMRQIQYELEGRIKLLTQSVEKTKKELYEERLKKDKHIADKAKEFEIQESNLRKEIEKMKSAMQFKDQEMKSVYSKIHTLEGQLKEKQESNSAASLKRNAESFSSSFGTGTLPAKEKSSLRFHRKSKLSLDASLGQLKGSDLVSSLLCNRMSVFQSQKCPVNTASSESSCSNSAGLFTMSVVKLTLEQEDEELLEHYKNVLTRHIVYLQSLCSKNTMPNCKTSPLSARHKEINNQKVSVISCLKDIQSFLLHHTVSETQQKGPVESMVSLQTSDGSNQSVSTNPLLSSTEQRAESSNALSLLLKPLVQLANAETYPNGYNKVEEIELSLCSLLACSYNFPHKLLNHMCEFPISSLLNIQNDTSCICMTLKIMVNLLNSSAKCGSTGKLIEFLTHKASGCLICTMSASLQQAVSFSLEKCILPLSLAIDFLSSLFSSSLFAELKIESSQCIKEVIQCVVPSLWQCLYKAEKKNLNIKTVLTKGILFIYLMSSLISNFKEKRNGVENTYISLVCGTLTLSKENLEYKELYDVMHNLWDFQEDMSEFDLEETNDDSSQLDSEIPHNDEL